MLEIESMTDQSQSLFDRIGGEETVSSLVEEFYDRVLGDDELAPFFEETDMEKQRRMQREFFGAALGAPIKYSGRPLNEAHAGLGIELRHFQLFVGHLLDTLKRFNFSEREVDDIIDHVNSYVGDITGESTVDG